MKVSLNAQFQTLCLLERSVPLGAGKPVAKAEGAEIEEAA